MRYNGKRIKKHRKWSGVGAAGEPESESEWVMKACGYVSVRELKMALKQTSWFLQANIWLNIYSAYKYIYICILCSQA